MKLQMKAALAALALIATLGGCDTAQQLATTPVKASRAASPSASLVSTSTSDAAAQQAAQDAAAAQAAAAGAKSAAHARAAAVKAAAARAKAKAAAAARAQAAAAARAEAAAAARAQAAAQTQADQDTAAATADSFDKEYAKVIAGRIIRDIATGDERFLDRPDLGGSTTMDFLSTDMEKLLSCGTPGGVSAAKYQALVTTLQDFYAKAAMQLPDDITGAAATYTVARQHTADLLKMLNPALGTNYSLPRWSYV